jgi:hypothetical protein
LIDDLWRGRGNNGLVQGTQKHGQANADQSVNAIFVFWCGTHGAEYNRSR